MDEAVAARPSIAWAAVREDYEAGVLTRNAVAAKHGVPLPEIESRARDCKWSRPNSEVTDRRILIFKLLALLERQIDQVDAMMKQDPHREISVLTNLVRDLDKLIAIEKAETGPLLAAVEDKEMRDLQRKLEKRINAITKG